LYRQLLCELSGPVKPKNPFEFQIIGHSTNVEEVARYQNWRKRIKTNEASDLSI